MVRSSDEGRETGWSKGAMSLECFSGRSTITWEESNIKTKPFCISKWAVLEAWKRVKANKGAAGVDEVSIAEFEIRLKDNLYRIWNRMSSGTYFPPPVRTAEIPKKDGGKRTLGIPTVADRVAQMVVKLYLEPHAEPCFHRDSYGYRPGKSALEAVGVTRGRCWQYNWVLDLDIKGFFDNIDHSLMMRAVRKHTNNKWILLYIERWLKGPILQKDGSLISRQRGTPQGGVVSPLLANIFLHHAFDAWMGKEHPAIPFERYADDIVVHCRTEREAQFIRRRIEERLGACKLEVHPVKTKVVYCKDGQREGRYAQESFDFLGYTFRPRFAKNYRGRFYVRFLPAISNKASQAIRDHVKSWHLHRMTSKTLEDFSHMYNAVIRGWVNYYGAYYKSALYRTLRYLNRRLAFWTQQKFKRLRSQRNANRWLRRIARKEPNLFFHWKLGIIP